MLANLETNSPPLSCAIIIMSNSLDENPATMPPSLRLALQLSMLPSEKFDEVLANLATLPFDIWDDDAAAAADPSLIARDMNARLARMSPFDKSQTALLCVQDFQQTGNVNTLDQGIGLMRNAIQGYTETGDVKGKFDSLCRLTSFLSTRFRRTSDFTFLNAAIDSMREALELDQESDATPELFYTLGQLLLDRFRHSGERDDLSGSLDSFLQGFSILPAEDRNVSLFIQNIAVCIRMATERPQLREVFLTFKDNIFLGNQSSLAPTRRAHILHYIGSNLLGRFQSLGRMEDLENAMAFLQRSTELETGDPGAITVLGVSRLIHFEQTGNEEDLLAAVALQKRALQMIDQEDERTPGVLNNLGNALHLLFELSGDVANLDEAVNVHSRALYHLKLKEDEKYTHHYSLAKSYQRRFEHLEDLGDLDLAINSMENALRTMPDDDPLEARMLSSCGGAYYQLYSVTHEQSRIEHSVKLQRKAVFLTPTEHPARALRLVNFAQALIELSHPDANLEVIDEAVRHLEEALSLMGNSRVDTEAIASFSLSRALRRSYEIKKAMKDLYQRNDHFNDLNKAIDAGYQAVRTLRNTLQVAEICEALASSLLLRYRDAENPLDSDRSDAMELFQKGSLSPSKPPVNQFLCALRWGYLCIECDGIPAGVEAFKKVFKMIPRVIWIGNHLHRRYTDAKLIWIFLGDAVALAIKASNLRLALEWAEEGRCIVWRQILQLRQDPSEGPLGKEIKLVTDKLQHMGVDSHRPSPNITLASQLIAAASLAISRDSPIPGMSPEEFSQRMAAFALAASDMQKQEQRRLAEQYESLVSQAQSISQFPNETFHPKTFADFLPVTQSGPVIFINICAERCDAIALVPWQQEPLLIPLENFSQEQAEQMLSTFITDLEAKGVRTKSRGRSTSSVTGRIRALLGTLWTDVVYPVLKVLGPRLQQFEDGRLPHITWCPSGPLTFLPLHAAGVYKTNGGDKIFDHAVSSYTPNFAALIAAQKHSAAQSAVSPRLLAVSQPNTPNAEELPSTIAEVEALQKMYPDLTWLNDSDGTKDAVMEGIREHHWVHFACHAVLDLDNPLQSAFLLQGKSLELADLMTQSFDHTQLAYLSACRTAAGHEQLSEEAVHLVAGMLMAGFQNVIGTLWAIDDDDANFVAQHFYQYLQQNGHGNSSHSSYALHHAVGQLRSSIGEKYFLRWIPFIHFGV
ncbi:hypothetical protein GYMLUDRAFT_265863 [Collybiopsis luxurians FD-317 M1]|uniref:CHAT domain-containing protein n=1 Tax=Collybiopsis luxurians FD-317 M1 TaxID=944289 RepID=A0A0D0BAN3_9AGAR|nr:hypothetical protein GYMLUDRAFT_265863 [Collybiopsis luxurians FD-317 M1]